MCAWRQAPLVIVGAAEPRAFVYSPVGQINIYISYDPAGAASRLVADLARLYGVDPASVCIKCDGAEIGGASPLGASLGRTPLHAHFV